MKQVYCKSFNKKGIESFITEARDKYYAEDNDYVSLIMKMGKAIAYAEAGWAMSKMTEDDANQLIHEAESIIEEIIC